MRDADWVAVDYTNFDLELTITQTHYMDVLLPRFVVDYDADDTENVPETIVLNILFTTYDPTNMDRTIYDHVTVIIHSNGDHGQCVGATYEFTADADLETDGVEFIVPMGLPADTPTSHTIGYTQVTDGTDSPVGCANLLKTVLEIRLANSLSYAPYDASVNTFVAEWDDTDKNHVKFSIVEGDLSTSPLSDYTDGIVPMRFSHYATPVSPGDQPLYTEAFEVTFRMQTNEERCDVAELSVLRLQGAVDYEVTTESTSADFVMIEATQAEANLAGCTVTQTLQILNADGATWDDFVDDSSYPFVTGYDSTTLAATIGYTYPVPLDNAMTAWKDADAKMWTIHMRYYTAIQQANPTEKGWESDEFTVVINEKLYDPCNSNTINSLSSATNIGYDWTNDMS
jgi:hypothetical protein